MSMMIVLYVGVAAAAALVVALAYVLFGLKADEAETEQSEWYDSEGNHIYYDRKYIRYRQQLKNRAASSQE